MHLAFWRWRCRETRLEPGPVEIPCVRLRNHGGKHCSLFGIEW